MRVSFIALFISVALAAPSNFLEVTRNVDWESALTGHTDGLEKRARSEKSMDAIFKSLGKKYFGTCADRSLLSNSQNTDVIKADFGQLTPENSGKWQTTEPTQGTFNFNDLDFLVNWAQTNNKYVRGHTTVWYSQLPSWVSNVKDKATLTSVIQKHVTTEIGRYAGKVLQWDVVNEMFDESGGLRSSVFSNVLGEDFVRIAFEAARAADPAAKLYINDYNTVEKGSTYAKTTGMINSVKKWIAAGIPIDGIGAQTHLMAGEAKNVPASLALLCAAASECAITEMDIVNAAAGDYVTAVKACVDIPNCVGVTVWGVRDPDSWRAASSPLLFNSGYATKPAYGALVETIGAMTPAAPVSSSGPATVASAVIAKRTDA